MAPKGAFVTLKRLIRAGLVVGLSASLQLAVSEVLLAQQTPPGPAPQGATGGPQPGRGRVDPRVQQRTYTFADTSEQLPYALYVSSKVTKDKKNPLIISLHGLGGNQDTMVRESLGAVELAEQGGYILATPMGYNCGGWYGIPAGARGGGGRGPAAPAPPQAGAAQAGAPQAAAPQAGAPNANAAGAPQRGGGRGGRGGGQACTGGGTAVTDAAKVRELSEKDVMTVLDMLRKEFNVDERRIYVMGHSMGGSGTLHLASKYPQIWAAAAAIAPPGAGGAGVAESLGMSKLPTFVVQGDMDTAVPVNGTRQFIERLKAQNATYEYLEIPGADHSITGIPEIYKFFAKHTKPAR
jgi:poly(3-hydroxybutyrate) depolymerase